MHLAKNTKKNNTILPDAGQVRYRPAQSIYNLFFHASQRPRKKEKEGKDVNKIKFPVFWRVNLVLCNDISKFQLFYESKFDFFFKIEWQLKS